MDVTQLYNLTTPELRAEAMRLNVQGTSEMTRAQLIDAIRRHARGASAPRKGFLGRVMGIAKWAASAATDASTSSSGQQRAAAAPKPIPPTAVPTRPPTPPPIPAAAVAQGKTAAGTPGAAAAVTQGTAAPAGVFGGAGVARPSTPAAVFEEPFPTRTMARILAEQGHHRRALAIYARLIEEQPSDQELRNEARQIAVRRQHAP